MHRGPLTGWSGAFLPDARLEARVATVSIDEKPRSQLDVAKRSAGSLTPNSATESAKSCLLHRLSSNICSYACPRVAAARFVGLEFVQCQAPVAKLHGVGATLAAETAVRDALFAEILASAPGGRDAVEEFWVPGGRRARRPGSDRSFDARL